MKFSIASASLLALCFGASVSSAAAQTVTGRPAPTPTPSNSVINSKIADVLAQNLQRQTSDVSRERREQAYAKLLEGQRYLWSRQRARSQSSVRTALQLARQSVQQAVELDPRLAEAYIFLAELTLLAPPFDSEEAIKLADIGVKLNNDNFGAHRILARLYTLKSGIGRDEGNLSGASASGALNAEFTNKAISEWKEIVRLDPRSAEAWAFLAAFYEAQGKKQDRIDALNNWISAATPLETGFYQNVFGKQDELSPENATTKLGSALIANNQTKEAIQVLSRAVADDPGNSAAIEMLREAVEAADASTASTAVDALKQAVYANPDNISLIRLLAGIQARAGNIDDSAKILNDSIAKLAEKDKNAAANLQASLADVYADNDRFDEAVKNYRSALTLRGITNEQPITDDDRDFAITIYDKMIRAYKNAGRAAEAASLIEEARRIFGRGDLFADRQLIDFYRETGKSDEALKVLKSLRVKNPGEYSLMRLEAALLTDMGKVDEGVAIIQPLIGKTSTVPSIMNDDFVNHLFISSLYSQGKRGKLAIDSANKAYVLAQDAERKQIAKLTLATAQQRSGDFAAAETTLRELLRQNSRNPIALNNLGYFLVERNQKLDEALSLIEQAVRIDPTNPSYLDSLGWANFQLGKYTEAEKHLKNAAKYDASSATIQEHLGDVYQKLNKSDLAKRAWQKALNLTSDAEEVARLKAKLK